VLVALIDIDHLKAGSAGTGSRKLGSQAKLPPEGRYATRRLGTQRGLPGAFALEIDCDGRGRVLPGESRLGCRRLLQSRNQISLTSGPTPA